LWLQLGRVIASARAPLADAWTEGSALFEVRFTILRIAASSSTSRISISRVVIAGFGAVA
jgi:hypothetical protein